MKTTTTRTVAYWREWISDKSLTRPLDQQDYGSTVWGVGEAKEKEQKKENKIDFTNILCVVKQCY